MANRRNILLGSGAALALATSGLSTLLGATSAFAQQVDTSKLMAPAGDYKDHPLGNPDSKVVLVEYLSPTCPHCAAFAANVYPQLKTEYIDTNKIQYIPRPFIRNVLDAVVFMLAEAAGPEQYHQVVDTFMRTQDQWLTSQTPNDDIFKVAQQLGFTKESYDAALTNQTLFTGLEKVRDQAMNEFKLQGTPTFYLNGKMLTGDTSLEALKAEIDPLLS